ncbi:MAG: UDP-N-acetylmuramoyl-L-alanyl-D-glutamate--2,6-diaminopimelate ligase [Candidatus Methylacidiphilales bacterium]|nr:UDP-N-acetylmuramoyl-L-alanyl-D-glutamate--2,6-diaminopimelate ligase [Candidatus Methylacidiphilales bacterium]
MTLRDLFSGLEVLEWSGPKEASVSGLAYRADEVNPGDAFFTWKGLKSDGHRYVSLAVERGAAAVVVEEKADPAPSVPQVRVASGRRALAGASSRWYGNPGASLRLAGITGTNGKTSTAYLLHHLLETSGISSGLMGTICYRSGKKEMASPRTTPECLDLQRLLAQMRDENCRAAVMEVSSHALDQERTLGLGFEVAVFTNLTQDHLDYHGSMENYFQAKSKLFTSLRHGSHAVINLDDGAGLRLAGMLPAGVHLHGYSLGAAAEHQATDVCLHASGTTFKWKGPAFEHEVVMPWVGGFNVANALAAAAAACAFGLAPDHVAASLRTAPPVPGRMERIPSTGGFSVLVDYAHTDDAIRHVLSTLRPLCRGRLLVLVGCGGDRDRGKRPLMARAAVEQSDWAVLTSDNPRGEDPAAILRDMERGVSGMEGYEVVADRAAAIAHIISLAKEGDVVVLAGKGHENTQEVKGVLTPFSDAEQARAALRQRGCA